MPTDSSTPTVLVAHHDAAARDRLADQLVADGYDVLHAGTERNCAQTLEGYEPCMLILGVLDTAAGAPRLLRTLRADALPNIASNLPVITVGPGDRTSVLRAYEAGSDHHLPCEVEYLILRAIVAAVTRRCAPPATATSGVLERGRLRVDVDRRQVSIDGRPVDLSRKEFELLRRLALEPTTVMTKDALLEELWGHGHDATTRTLDSHAYRLRRRLSDAGYDAIHNVWGVGYRLQT